MTHASWCYSNGKTFCLYSDPSGWKEFVNEIALCFSEGRLESLFQPMRNNSSLVCIWSISFSPFHLYIQNEKTIKYPCMDFGKRVPKTVVLYIFKITRQKEKYLSDTKKTLKLIDFHFNIKHTNYRTNKQFVYIHLPLFEPKHYL